MDINGLDPSYKEANMQESYDETRRLISAMSNMKLVEPIITPRFALTCSISLMKGLKSSVLGTENHLKFKPLVLSPKITVLQFKHMSMRTRPKLILLPKTRPTLNSKTIAMFMKNVDCSARDV